MLLKPLIMATRAMILANEYTTASTAAYPTPTGTNTNTGWWCHFTMKRGGRALRSIVPMISTILITHNGVFIVVVAVAMKLVVLMTIISMKYGFTITTDKTTMRI